MTLEKRIKESCLIVADLFEAIPEVRTTRAMAKNYHGRVVDIFDPKASKWCMVGAIKACTYKTYEVWKNYNYMYTVELILNEHLDGAFFQAVYQFGDKASTKKICSFLRKVGNS